MSVKDRVKALQTFVATQSGTRAFAKLENNKRTRLALQTISAEVNITVGGSAVANKGSVLALAGQCFFSDGGTDKVLGDARLLRFLNECMAPSALPATRLAGAGIQTTTISEQVWLPLACPRTVNPGETAYVEPNKQLDLLAGVIPTLDVTRVATGATGTVSNFTVRTQQWYDDLLGNVPLLNVFYREVAQTVAGANNTFRIDLRGNRYLAGLFIQQDTDQGEQSDIISSLVLRGDNFPIIGDQQVPYADLANASAIDFGGAVTLGNPGGYLGIWFPTYGRLSGLWNPFQDTNLRLELTVAPSGGGRTGSLVRVGLLEWERTPATVGDDVFRQLGI